VENLWSLVRDREQGELDLPTKRPVEDFDTGFLGASIAELGALFWERYDKESSSWDKPECVMSRKTFAVLDERGLRENNILVAHWWFKEDDEDKRTEEIVEDDDPDVFGWKTLRVPFFAAAELTGSIDEADFEIIDESKYNPGQSMTEDGIFVLPGMEERYAEHGLHVKDD
jgi:hypothetical protein